MEYSNDVENDNEIIFMINENNEHATEYLIKKYDKVIRGLVTKYSSISSKLGLEENDLYIEGLYGLISAIESYNYNKDAKFSTYAYNCINNKILTLMNRNSSLKHKPLNNSISLDYVSNDIKDNLYNYIGIKDNTNKIDNNELLNEIISNLRGLEKEIFLYKIKGYSNNYISIKLNIDKKKIENALFRIKNKYKNYYLKK